MLKGRFLAFILAFLAMLGAASGVQARTKASLSEENEWASSCSSIMVSTPLCDEILNQTCILNKKIERHQTKPSVITASAQTQPALIAAKAESVTINLDSNKIFDLVNQYRTSQGLSPFEQENSVCKLAQLRSSELAGELANGTTHSGLYNRNLPYWIWENAKMGSSEEETVDWWLASPLHKQSIIGDYKYSCVRCNGTYCSQLFTSFSPK